MNSIKEYYKWKWTNGIPYKKSERIKKTTNDGQLTINDIGCNYGQVYKEIKRKGLIDKLIYRGYGIDPNFLEIGRKNYPEISDSLECFNIELSVPPHCDITIFSATFEHLDDPKDALRKILLTTSKDLYLRTMVGSSNIEFTQSDTRFSSAPYNINQFNLFELSQIF